MEHDQKRRPDSGVDGPDWRDELARRLCTVDAFESVLRLSERERRSFGIPGMPPVAVTPYYLSLMDPEDPACPIRRQALPDPEDVRSGPGESDDPLGERSHSPVGGVIHRYPDRVVLLVSSDCPVRCRHCNRRSRSPDEFLGSPRERERAIRYLQGRREVREVILSGGDPLTLTDETLAWWLTQLRRIEQVQTLRIHSRTPVTCPARVTPELTDLLRRFAPLYLVTQFNHPLEVTAAAAHACARLADAGIPLANQAVLLRGINSEVGLLAELSRALLRIRVRPYYLFQLDPVVGTERFRTPVQAGIDLVDSLRGRLSGLGVPQFALDAPGGFGKVVLSRDALVPSEPGEVRVRTWQGDVVAYPDTGDPDLRCPPARRP